VLEFFLKITQLDELALDVLSDENPE